MTRTYKWGNAQPKYFTHTGNFHEYPNKVKKNGAGKGNWGVAGDELNDLIDNGEAPMLINKTRRGSNSLKHELKLKSVLKAGLSDDEDALE